MQVLGVLLIAGGCIGGLVSYNEDTSVESSGGSRVHNIGLIATQRNHLIISGFVAVAGILFFGFGQLTEKPLAGPSCPLCNGTLEGTPQICRHCRSELRWLDDEPMTPTAFEERLKAQRRLEAQLHEEAKRREAAAAKMFANLGSKTRRAIQGSKKAMAGAGSSVLGIGPAFDGVIRKAAGDGNQIIYRFLQAMIYLAVPAAVGLMIAARSGWFR